MPDTKAEEKQVANSLPFKNPDYVHSNVQNGKKKPWKTLRQILAQTPSSSDDSITYSSLDAPPSFKPAKKYSDLSGLETTYTDPQTKLHYASPEEFQDIRRMPSDLIQGYLTLRRANNLLQ
eukprot:TRINITY_DN7949_c0_g1_i1.p1 TRINITY_DN7949_c0_g1~~TRINITY_DN7949_c0_g1_i1.p1  ORF type:complete len:121 (+),score=17.22 TRINITY_DN7949_c0_g1_i1:57-419(+)